MGAVHVRAQGAVLVLEIDRPERRNAIDMPMFATLAGALQRADADAAVGAVLLCGAGEGYTAGHDLRAFDLWPQRPADPVPRFLHALAGLRKPLVIAVQGWAVGIGATSLLHADRVLATPDARLRFPFVELGIAPEAASSLLLARAVGTLRARQLLLGAETITGAQAHAWGLVSELVGPQQLRGEALACAARLAAQPAATYRRIKDWLAPAEEVHARIDEEIGVINRAVLERRGQRSAA